MNLRLLKKFLIQRSARAAQRPGIKRRASNGKRTFISRTIHGRHRIVRLRFTTRQDRKIKLRPTRTIVRKRRVRVKIRPVHVQIPHQVPPKGLAVFTYFDNVPGINRKAELELLELWKKSWKKFGWRPFVISKVEAQRHPEYRTFYNRMKTYPFSCSEAYDMACYLRWMAMEVVGGGFMSDYDCLNYGFRADSLPNNGALTYYFNSVPCLVSGTADQFHRARIHMQTINLSAHLFERRCNMTNDMYLMVSSKLYLLHRIGRDLCEGAEWRNAPLVHWSNRGKTEKGFRTKLAAIRTLRPL